MNGPEQPSMERKPVVDKKISQPHINKLRSEGVSTHNKIQIGDSTLSLEGGEIMVANVRNEADDLQEKSALKIRNSIQNVRDVVSEIDEKENFEKNFLPLKNLTSTLNEFSDLLTNINQNKMSTLSVTDDSKLVTIRKVPELIEKMAFVNADKIVNNINSIAKEFGPEVAKRIYDSIDHKREKDGFIFNNMQKTKDFLPVRVQRPGDWKSRLGAIAYSVTKGTLAATEIITVNSAIAFLNAVDALSGGTKFEPLHTKSVFAKEFNNVFGVVSQRDFWRAVSYSEAIFYNALKTDPKNPDVRLEEWNERRVLMLEELARRGQEFERLLERDAENKRRWSVDDIHRYKAFEGDIEKFKSDLKNISPDREDQRYIERVMQTYQENPSLRRVLQNTILGTPIRERLAAALISKEERPLEIGDVSEIKPEDQKADLEPKDVSIPDSLDQRAAEIDDGNQDLGSDLPNDDIEATLDEGVVIKHKKPKVSLTLNPKKDNQA